MMENLLFNGFSVLIASISSAFFSFHLSKYFLMPNGYLC